MVAVDRFSHHKSLKFMHDLALHRTVAKPRVLSRRLAVLKGALAIALVVLALLPTTAPASWLELCDFDGRIASAVSKTGEKPYSLVVSVTAARHSPRYGLRGYTDCSEHLGTDLEITLEIPRLRGIPAVGDEISFFRSAVDTFAADGAFAGSRVSVEFHSLRKTRSDDEG